MFVRNEYIANSKRNQKTQTDLSYKIVFMSIVHHNYWCIQWFWDTKRYSAGCWFRSTFRESHKSFHVNWKHPIFYKEICSIKLLWLKSFSLDTITYHYGPVKNFCDLHNELSTGVDAQYLGYITLLWRSGNERGALSQNTRELWHHSTRIPVWIVVTGDLVFI